MINNYYDLLESTLSKFHLHKKPSQIFNIDESGFPLNPKPPKTLCCRGTKTPSVFTSTDRSQITVVGCVSASGHAIPPMVIWDRKTLSPDLANGEVPGTIYGLSDKGWIDMELFDTWFKRHFLRHAPAARPLLLLMDGHSSHYCLDTIHLAAQDEVVIFVLPPNTTHLSQPLDKGVFGPLKQAWMEVCYGYLAEHPGQVVTKFEFSQLFSKAWMGSMTMQNIVSGFSTTGIYPFDRNAVRLPIASNPTVNKSYLNYVTLYTPLKRQVLSFTDDELDSFQKCYDGGFDMQSDSRYVIWLKTKHPERLTGSESRLSDSYQPSKHISCIQKFLEYPSPPVKRSVTEESSARVLTSTECIKQLEEKRRLKEAKQEEKKRREEEKKKKKEEKQQKQAKGKSKKKFVTSTPSKGMFVE